MGKRHTDSVISLVIIEDHLMVSEALRLAFEAQPDLHVVGHAATLQDGLDVVATTRPDVVLLDSRLPDGQTPDAITSVLAACDTTKVVVLSAAGELHTVLRSLEVGASGYLLKGQQVTELFDGIREAHAGERPLAPQLVSNLVNSIGKGGGTRHLSRREVEVLTYLAEGLSTAELCERMNLSVNTVRNHVQSAIRRLGAHSKLEAVAIAQREGLITVL